MTELNNENVISTMNFLKDRSLKNLNLSIKYKKLYDKDIAKMKRMNKLLEEINNKNIIMEKLHLCYYELSEATRKV